MNCFIPKIARRNRSDDKAGQAAPFFPCSHGASFNQSCSLGEEFFFIMFRVQKKMND